MFEDNSYENLLERLLDMAPDGIDTRQGEVFYDAVSAMCLPMARSFADLETLYLLVSLPTTAGEYLDRKANEHGLSRQPPTPSRYKAVFVGTKPPNGERFFTDNRYFTVQDEVFIAEEAGDESNGILLGTPAIPLSTIVGLQSSEFGDLLEPGTSIEDDDSLRKRLQEKIAGPAENGNKQHYKSWCESISGVGRARILPLWNGPNTVKGVIFDMEGRPASQSVVDRVQEYVDPGGTGYGEGQANLGAKFSSVPAQDYDVVLSSDIVLNSGYSMEQAEAEITEAITQYFKSLALDSPEDAQNVVVRIATIGALINNLPSILDYGNLLLNSQDKNILLELTQAAHLSEVRINAAL